MQLAEDHQWPPPAPAPRERRQRGGPVLPADHAARGRTRTAPPQPARQHHRRAPGPARAAGSAAPRRRRVVRGKPVRRAGPSPAVPRTGRSPAGRSGLARQQRRRAARGRAPGRAARRSARAQADSRAQLSAHGGCAFEVEEAAAAARVPRGSGIRPQTDRSPPSRHLAPDETLHPVTASSCERLCLSCSACWRARRSTPGPIEDCGGDGELARQVLRPGAAGRSKTSRPTWRSTATAADLQERDQPGSDKRDGGSGPTAGGQRGGGGGGGAARSAPTSRRPRTRTTASARRSPATRTTRQAQPEARRQGDQPGADGLFDLASATNDIPIPLLVALVAIGLLVILGGLVALRDACRPGALPAPVQDPACFAPQIRALAPSSLRRAAR